MAPAFPVEPGTLALFCVAALGLLVSPGPNMAFVLSHGLSHGARGGVAVAAGILVADLAMTALVALGVAALVAAWPPAFDLLRLAGAAMLLWLAWKAWRGRGGVAAAHTRPRPLREVFAASVAVSLFNPKALLFFLVFLPQFVRPGAGRVTAQLVELGVVLALLAFGFHALLGAFAARLGALAHTRGAAGLGWLPPAIYAALAMRLLALQRSL